MRYCDIVRQIERGPKAPAKVVRPKGRKHWEALKLWLKGHTYFEIGQVLGVSRQRAQQMIAPHKVVRNTVKTRANGKCEHCHIPTVRGHIHHVKVTSKTPETFNSLDNLRYLCAGCHRTAHCNPAIYKL